MHAVLHRAESMWLSQATGMWCTSNHLSACVCVVGMLDSLRSAHVVSCVCRCVFVLDMTFLSHLVMYVQQV